MRARVLLLGLVLGLTALVPVANAAAPAAGTVSPVAPTSSWTGGPFVTSNPSGVCFVADPACDAYALTIVPPASGNYMVEITTTPSAEGDDYDLYVNNSAGQRVGSSTTDGGHEKVTLSNPPGGTYTVNTLAWLVQPGGTYQGKATLAVSSAPPTSDPGNVLYSYDPNAAQARVEVPLRVVAVGFAPGELDEAKILGEIPNYQRPGVLIPRGEDSSGDQFPLFGAETLVNHGRNYYNNTNPFTVPYEYTWKPKFVYAPAGFTQGLFNTWDSAEARAILKPQNEYHVWKINRTDPDTGQFDGIDWARIWGGRYRFMMVDTGAAPNPYEAESWGNRNRSVYGSANYEPPLWEYRAKAPRPVTLVNIDEGVEQALTPGATWDDNQLNFMLARTVNEATSFRFLHSYLYEPYPATGQYWFSDNVWHDAKAELPWASDLKKLYNQSVVLAGLRTLTPYLTFAGDVRFAYLAEGGADNDADQAMLDQAKQDGDDTSGAPGVSMHTDTAMDYIDQQSRLFRGGPCYTTVPAINVVAEKHYAWALPIAAGIATNRNGVPWGYLGSVNDVFKSPTSDRDQSMAFAHPEVSGGAFTYTAIHEASHYLGLAHPHDSIGATRKADGSPRYYDGFTWAFNSTASPTTYSHAEIVYSILDQENIARGHAAYYLKWTDQALSEGGEAYASRAVTLVSLLPADAARLRKDAIDFATKAEHAFAKFDFVNATFAAQNAWRSAAAYRDIALGLAPGTSELEKGTKKEGASDCPSAHR